MQKKTPSRKKLIVGLTGGIATGKTTIAYLLRQFGAKVICCDELAHRALRKYSRTYRAIISVFGKGILDKGKKINRKKLAEIIFKHKIKRQALEAIIHPFVFQKIFECIKKAKGILIIDVPLLFETGFQKHVDYTIVVSCTRSAQVERLMKRDNLSRKEALQRLRVQFPLARKKKLADWVIHNQEARRAVAETKRIWDKIVTMRIK